MQRLESRLLMRATEIVPTRVAVIGDYGFAGQPEEDVANLVKGWNPDLILTVGDNNYPEGAADTIDANVGQYYHDFIYNYTGTYGTGSPTRRFLPALGNHDWIAPAAQPYLDYFDLPGNERYYEFATGPVRFFMIDSDPQEPDGVSATSAQAQWLATRLAAAGEMYKLVLLHHSPYSSSAKHGSFDYVQWPFKEWGATAVIAGHDHTYERLNVGGLPYFVNGLGGRSTYAFADPIAGSEIRFNDDFGAMLLDANEQRLHLRFITRAGVQVDQYAIHATGPGLPTVSVAATDALASEVGRDPATFTFTRSGNTSDALTVHLTVGGDAGNGADYLTLPTSVTFGEGQSSATLSVRPIDDQLVERTETITVAIAPSDDYNVGSHPADIALTDNDTFNATYVPMGATWKYLDNGSNQGTAWRAPAFGDAAWASGPAQLGYGDGDEATVINGGQARFLSSIG